MSGPCGGPVEHFHAERNYQGKGNVLLFPRIRTFIARGPFNVASDWAGSCVITINRRRERRNLGL